jgi:hypothetical protein
MPDAFPGTVCYYQKCHLCAALLSQLCICSSRSTLTVPGALVLMGSDQINPAAENPLVAFQH